MNNKKKCFVIMPFSKAYSLTKEQWAEIFEHKIKPAVEDSGCGYNCERYELRRANITKDILDELNNSHLVVTDLTGSNPNVLWELGVRHTLSKRTILIAQDKKFLPSDLKDYPLVTYKYVQTPAEVNRFRQDIKSRLKDIEADPQKPDSPVADFLQLKNINILDYEKSANVKKLCALLTELSYNITYVDKILDTVKESQQVRKKDKGRFAVSPMRLSNACLELLFSTSYVILTDDLANRLKFIGVIINIINTRLDLWPQPGFAEGVEQKLMEELPPLKENLTSALKDFTKLESDYQNDNYEEPEEPTILVSTTEHVNLLKEIISPQG